MKREKAKSLRQVRLCIIKILPRPLHPHLPMDSRRRPGPAPPADSVPEQENARQPTIDAEGTLPCQKSLILYPHLLPFPTGNGQHPLIGFHPQNLAVSDRLADHVITKLLSDDSKATTIPERQTQPRAPRCSKKTRSTDSHGIRPHPQGRKVLVTSCLPCLLRPTTTQISPIPSRSIYRRRPRSAHCPARIRWSH